jgi:hypothetical protein
MAKGRKLHSTTIEWRAATRNPDWIRVLVQKRGGLSFSSSFLAYLALLAVPLLIKLQKDLRHLEKELTLERVDHLTLPQPGGTSLPNAQKQALNLEKVALPRSTL